MNDMPKVFYLALQNQLSFYKSLKLIDYFLVVFVHIFIAWNGIQLFLYPFHLNSIIDYHSLIQNLRVILDTQSNYVPLYIFILVTIVIIFFFIRNFLEIKFINLIKSETIKNKFNLLINFNVPLFFHNIGLLILLSSFLLVFLVVYLLLVVMNMQISIDIIKLIKYSILFFFTGLVFFNMIAADFILPELPRANSFSNAFIKFYRYFLHNKLNLCFFYVFKFCVISINMVIFIYFMKIFFHYPVLKLPLSLNITSTLLNILTLIVGVFVSLTVNSVIIMFLNIYCQQVQKIMFSDYSEFEHKSEHKKEDIV